MQKRGIEKLMVKEEKKRKKSRKRKQNKKILKRN